MQLGLESLPKSLAVVQKIGAWIKANRDHVMRADATRSE